MVVLAAGAVGVTLMYLLTPLNPNLRYEAGVKLAGTDTAAGTFSHRPLAYRLVTDAVFRTADLLSVGPVTFELAVRVLLALLALGAAVLLQQGLRQQHVRYPGLHAVVVAGALILLGGTSAGEPDWLAVVFTVAGTGLALRGDGRRPWLYATLAGAAFVAAAGMKIVTLPVAVIGLAVVLAVHRHLAVSRPGRHDRRRRPLRRRHRSSGCRGRSSGSSTSVPCRTAPPTAWPTPPRTPSAWSPTAPSWPCCRRSLVLARGRERALVAGAVVVTAGLVVAQGQYFGYHAIPLVVVAAVAAFRALRDRVSALRSAPLCWSLSWPRPWPVCRRLVLDRRTTNAAGSAGWPARPGRASSGRGAFVAGRPGGTAGGSAAAAVVALALLLPGATPWSTQLVRTENPDGAAAEQRPRDPRRPEGHRSPGGTESSAGRTSPSPT